MDHEAVTFSSNGLTIRGDLRSPATTPAPALVFTGPLSGVKEQVVGRYARELTDRGFVTLAFDHRGFGASDGDPRQDETSGGKLADLRDAVTFLSRHPWVAEQRIGAVGICLGGGYALRAAAADRRIGAVASVAGCVNDPAAFRSSMTPQGYHDTLRRFADGLTEDARSGAPRTIAAVGADREVAMPGDEPLAYYGTDRSSAPTWRNELTARSILALLTFEAASAADVLAPTPLLVVHGRADDYCGPEAIRRVAERHGEAEVVWLDAQQHIDLYDVDRFVTPAADALAEWFTRQFG